MSARKENIRRTNSASGRGVLGGSSAGKTELALGRGTEFTGGELALLLELKRSAQRRGVEAADVIDAVNEALMSTPTARATPVDQHTIDYLVAHSGVADTAALINWSPEVEDTLRARAAAATAAELGVALLSRDDAAAVLGIAPSRVSHMVREGKVYSVKRGGARHYPRWQFHDGQPLPGLSELIEVIGAVALHPVDLAAFMGMPAQELNGRSPVGHLRSHGDPARVAELLDAVGRQ